MLSCTSDYFLENEQLRHAFADHANALSAWIDGQLVEISNTAGEPEEQLAALGKLSGAQFEKNDELATLRIDDQALIDNGITENPHTNLSLQDLEAKWKLLHTSIEDKRSVLNTTVRIICSRVLIILRLNRRKVIQSVRSSYVSLRIASITLTRTKMAPSPCLNSRPAFLLWVKILL